MRKAISGKNTSFHSREDLTEIKRKLYVGKEDIVCS